MRVLRLTSAFERDFSKLPKNVQVRANSLVSILQTNVQDRRLNVKKLVNIHPTTWRLRIGTHRILFTYDRQTIYLLRFQTRKEVYRGLS